MIVTANRSPSSALARAGCGAPPAAALDEGGRGLAWYALRTRARHEKIAADDLRRRGVEHFLPLLHERRRWSDRVAEVALPLFPGYVFARCAARADRTALFGVRGTVGFVGFGGVPAPLDDAEIDRVRDLLARPASKVRLCGLFPGRLVEVRRGPLAGCQGTFLRWKNQDLLVVSIPLLGRAVAAEVAPSDVEVLG